MAIFRCLSLLLLALGFSLAVSSSEAPLTEISSEISDRVLQEVLSSKDFHNEKEITSVRLREEGDPAQSEDEIPEWIIELLEWLESRETGDDVGAAITLVNLLEALLWIVAIVVIFWFLYRYRAVLGTWLPQRSVQKQPSAPVAEVLFGLDLTEQSLPDDVPEQVLRLWFDQQPREALGLLYRASLSKLIYQYNFEFFDGHTERECAALVAANSSTAGSQLSAYIDGLTATWTRLAYAHRSPTEGQVQQLCKLWPQVFDQPSTVPPGAKGGRR